MLQRFRLKETLNSSKFHPTNTRFFFGLIPSVLTFLYIFIKKKNSSDIELLSTPCNQRKKHSWKDTLEDKLVSRRDHTLLHDGWLHVAPSATAAAGQLHGGQGDGAVIIQVDDFHRFHAGPLAAVGLEVRKDRTFQLHLVSELQIWAYRFEKSCEGKIGTAYQEICHLLLISNRSPAAGPPQTVSELWRV